MTERRDPFVDLEAIAADVAAQADTTKDKAAAEIAELLAASRRALAETKRKAREDE